ncbi:MAG: histidine phosphatase family protein [Rickettsiaceae bacterium]
MKNMNDKKNGKQIILMRHAHTQLVQNHQRDISRTLSDQGTLEAKAAAKFLSKYKIDKILVSPAMRTMQTLNLILSSHKKTEVEEVKSIYESSALKILKDITCQNASINSLMIIGHNPEILNLIICLANEKKNDNYDLLIRQGMKPAQIVIIDIPSIDNWCLSEERNGIITDIFTPPYEE